MRAHQDHTCRQGKYTRSQINSTPETTVEQPDASHLQEQRILLTQASNKQLVPMFSRCRSTDCCNCYQDKGLQGLELFALDRLGSFRFPASLRSPAVPLVSTVKTVALGLLVRCQKRVPRSAEAHGSLEASEWVGPINPQMVPCFVRMRTADWTPDAHCE